ncbi:MAG: glycosyl hydrolase family 18 protein [Patescibacteria group bacterium]
MKLIKNKLLIILFIFAVLFVVLIIRMIKDYGEATVGNQAKIIKNEKNDYKPYVGEINKSVFVPYWSLALNDGLNTYDRLIYFGILGTVDGINTDESGYINLQKFLSISSKQSEKYLTVRMTNTQENLLILKNKDSMAQIIDVSINIANQYGFSGLVLDLEISVLFGDEVINQISTFSNDFYRKSKENNLNYSIAIYGDLFYRGRPYDLATLAKNSDEIMIMAYDFHKSIGEPGPNFPLNGREIYGYDMEMLMDDFLQYVGPKKITVIFGMYGYDWIVDEQERPIKAAQVLTLNQIRSKHSNDCNEERCEFVDDADRRHVIWFENEESVAKKIEYLKSRGIGSFAYWAAGYF